MIELRPVGHITTDAIGPPGQRVFYIQAWKDEQAVSVIVEKFQVQTLAVGVEQFLAEVNGKFPDLADASADYDEEVMRIQPPVEALFRAAQVGLGYDPEGDLVALELREVPQPGEIGVAADVESAAAAAGESGVVRFWCTRSQIRALVNWGLEVAARGRPLCPQCGQAMDPEGHFCPRKNGHKH
jgi:uncharacterized repeat protein (TIGR03847 family)